MGFLKALLTAFVQFVHPYAPVLDVSTICRVLRGESGCISILTLQSMAFVAVPYVDMDYIHSVGFTSRRACRKAFYEKARVRTATPGISSLETVTDNLTSYSTTTTWSPTSWPPSNPSFYCHTGANSPGTVEDAGIGWELPRPWP